jgi:MoaA/NifB/PqqE/SkfB family radical SAM enzyme
MTRRIGSDLSLFLGKAGLERLAGQIRSNVAPPGPCFVEFHITNRCNASCYFCNQQTFRAGEDEIPVELFEKLLVEFRKSGLKFVRLSGGGEPTVHSGIARILDLLDKYEIAIARFDSNGIALSKELARKLIALKLGTLHISLQAPERQAWAAATGLRPGGFDAVMRNLSMFQDLNAARSVRVLATVAADRTTLGLLDEALRIEERLGIRVHMHPLNSHPYSGDFFQDLGGAVTRIAARPRNSGRSRQLEDLLRIPHPAVAPLPVRWPVCAAPWAGALVKPGGGLFLCCAWQAPFGDVLQEGVGPAWRGANFARFRSEMHRVFLGGASPSGPAGGQSRLLPASCFRACPIRASIFRHPAFDSSPSAT